MPDKEIYKVLKKFGLSDNETTVYVESLKKDELSPFQISKITNIPRTTVYDVLMSLSLKGLVELDQSDGFQKQQTKVKAKNPSVLRKILQNKRDESVKVEVQITEILPELKSMFHKQESNADFKFYSGIKGMKKVYSSIENNDLDIDQFTWTQLMPLDVFGSKNINEDVKYGTVKRKKAGAIARELIPLNAWTKHVMTYQYGLDKNYISNHEFRYIDSPLFECFLDLVIRGDYVRIACADKDEVWGLVVRSEALAKTLKSIYLLMWNMATPVTKETIKKWGKNKFLEQQNKLKR